MSKVDDLLADGWRPAKTVERLWVRGGVTHREGDDRDLVEDWNESEPMTVEQEQELIERRYSDG